MCNNNMFFLKSSYKAVIAITVIIFIIGGCAETIGHRVVMDYPQGQQNIKWPDAEMENRFREYWYNRFAGNTEEGYRMEAPHMRETVPFEKYSNYVKHAQMNKLIDIQIQKISRETEYLVVISCTVRTRAISGVINSTPIADRWVMVDKNWYHVIHDPILLPS